MSGDGDKNVMITGSNTRSGMSSCPVLYPLSAVGAFGFTCRY